MSSAIDAVKLFAVASPDELTPIPPFKSSGRLIVKVSLSDEVGVILLTNGANYSSMIEIEEALFIYSDTFGFDIKGDLNFDGNINIVDIVLLINFILEDQYSSIGDLNSDGLLNIQDVVLIIELILESE